jgi:hypothetical protein
VKGRVLNARGSKHKADASLDTAMGWASCGIFGSATGGQHGHGGNGMMRMNTTNLMDETVVHDNGHGDHIPGDKVAAH